MTKVYFRNEDGSLGCGSITCSNGVKLPVDEIIYDIHSHLIEEGRDIRPPILVVVDGGVCGKSS